MTPIQELKEQLVEEDIRGLSIDYYLQKEKEFAKQCFEAGKNCSDNEWMDSLGALKKPDLDFETFFKQFEK